jgi:hypothetical protein
MRNAHRFGLFFAVPFFFRANAKGNAFDDTKAARGQTIVGLAKTMELDLSDGTHRKCRNMYDGKGEYDRVIEDCNDALKYALKLGSNETKVCDRSGIVFIEWKSGTEGNEGGLSEYADLLLQTGMLKTGRTSATSLSVKPRSYSGGTGAIFMLSYWCFIRKSPI